MWSSASRCARPSDDTEKNDFTIRLVRLKHTRRPTDMSARTAPIAIFTTNKSRQSRSRVVSRSASSFPGPTPHSDEGAAPGQNTKFGALTESERVETLGRAVLDSGALIFTKCHSGKFTSVNNNFLQAFGLESSEDVVGKTDDELIESVLASGKTFHHSYRGESITDLPKIWKKHDDEVMATARTHWYKERALLSGGEDTKLHEFVVMKSPFADGVVGVAVCDGI